MVQNMFILSLLSFHVMMCLFCVFGCASSMCCLLNCVMFRGGVLEISITASCPTLAAMFMALQLSIEA